MKKSSRLVMFLTVFTVSKLFAQVGIANASPQATLHVDGAKDNPNKGAPNATQESNDVAVTSTGRLGVGTITPKEKTDVRGAISFNGQAVIDKMGSGTIDYASFSPQARIISWGADTSTNGIISF
ncbi:hypothetical protein [Chryseobacterium wanjuense]